MVIITATQLGWITSSNESATTLKPKMICDTADNRCNPLIEWTLSKKTEKLLRRRVGISTRIEFS